MSTNSYKTKSSLQIGKKAYTFFDLQKISEKEKIKRLPFSLRILLENLLRYEDGKTVQKEDIQALLNWDPKAKPSNEIAFRPARVLLQDFTGVPAVVDLAAMRDAMKKLGGDPSKINPLQPAELVIDHSVQVDFFGSKDAQAKNTKIEFERNQERYAFLRWGQQAFKNFRVVPPSTGIVHQVNLEYLARVTMNVEDTLYPDTVVGTDSHTTMINGLGILGWGVGGIEAEAAMLGQPISMLVPQVVGFRLEGELREGATATDLVLTIVKMLREKGVVGKFVEFFGPGLKNLSLADRATISNMAPEYGATCGIFPVDHQTIEYLKLSGRSESHIEFVEEYYKAQGLFFDENTEDPQYSDTLALELGKVRPSLSGPKRPQDQIYLEEMKSSFEKVLPELKRGDKGKGSVSITHAGEEIDLRDGHVVIAAITSCTNTSNPSVMLAAGLLAKKARERGLETKPWVKTSLAPGSKVVSDYLEASGLLSYLEELRFHLVGYGCTTCIGNSGPLPEAVSEGIRSANLVATSVLSGNRNFEGRISPDVRANYLASPPLVVAFALAGSVDLNLEKDPLGKDRSGKEVFLKDIWPSSKEVKDIVQKTVNAEMFRRSYDSVFEGDENWKSLPVPQGETYQWDPSSTYVKHPPYFEGMEKTPSKIKDIHGARALALLGDSITTDHISPAGSISAKSPAAIYLEENGVDRKSYNSYGSRRGNHEIMMRGTFANIRLKNKLLQDVEGGYTSFTPTKTQMSIFEAAEKYRKDGTPLIILGGQMYGSGSSRDWAAKGPHLLGVKAVIAQSYERIHRSNLIGMGVLPLQFLEGENPEKLGLSGFETFDFQGIEEMGKEEFLAGRKLRVEAKSEKGAISFETHVRLDTPQELLYFKHGGILQYVLRNLL